VKLIKDDKDSEEEKEFEGDKKPLIDEEENDNQQIKEITYGPEEEAEEDGPYQFYKAVFHTLQNSPLDDIKPSKNLPLLAPLKVMNPGETDYMGIKIKLYKISCYGYGQPSNVKMLLVDREITKQFDLSTTSSSDKEERKDV
jgi:hypothetical protein